MTPHLPAWLRRAGDAPSSALLATVAFLLAIAAWPYAPQAALNVDPSWQAVLQIAGPRGMIFGRDLVFTYGPLGFLSVPSPFYGLGSAVAFVATTAIYVVLAWAVLRSAIRVVPSWIAVIAAFLVLRFATVLPPWETFEALVFFACVELLARPVGHRWPLVIAIAGAVAGAGLLGKLNVGIFAALMLLITAASIGRPRWASVAIFAAAGAIALVGVWLVTGGSLGDLLSYASWSVDVVRGYSEAMVVETPPSARWAYIAFAGCILILAWLAWQASAGWPRSRRLALFVLGAVLAFAQWKTAFSRNYVGYSLATLLIAVVPLAGHLGVEHEPEESTTSVAKRVVSRRPGRDAAILAFAAILMAALAGTRLGPGRLVDVSQPSQDWLSSALTFVVPGRLDRAIADTRAQLKALLEIDPRLIGRIGDRTFEIEQWNTVAAAAYPELHWRPLPFFQAYSVWTSRADDANAAVIRSPDGPERILRERSENVAGQPHAVDNRFVWWESPEATIESVCRYDELDSTDRWQVLGRTTRTCGPPEPLGTVVARAGQTVTVPVETRPDRLVIVKVHGLEPSVLDRIVSLLYRAGQWYVDLGPDRGRLRLVPGTAADGLLVAVPASIGYSRQFAFGPPITTIAMSSVGYAGPRPQLTYEFVSLPLQPATGGG